MRRALTAAAAGLGVGLGAAARVYHRSRQPFLEAVDPQLRHPALYLPMHLLADDAFARSSRFFRDLDRARPGERGVVISTLHAEFAGEEFRARVLVPEGEMPAAGRPAVLWTHGGGHLIGGPAFYDPQNSALAARLGAVVVAPSYPKSSEAPFPADHDKCWAALRWMQERGAQLGIDPARIAVAGDSAGGGLAAGVVQRAADEGVPVARQGLVYPMLDHRTTDKEGPVGQFIWTANSNRGAWASYLGADHLDSEVAHYASPTIREDLAGLPPTWIGVGELDLFHDEARAYYEALIAAGVEAKFRVYPGAYHGFDHIRPRSEPARQLVEDLITALRGL